LVRRAATLLFGGAVAGGLATGLMSAVMFAAKAAGLMGEMPPKKITTRLLGLAGRRPRSDATEGALASLAHIGFGAAGGSLFAMLEPGRRLPLPPLLTGMLFGAGIWLVSYRGWVPALGIMPPPERDRPGRPESMLLAHLAYGAALGALVGRFAATQ
jgi:hypothetical protein